MAAIIISGSVLGYGSQGTDEKMHFWGMNVPEKPVVEQKIGVLGESYAQYRYYRGTSDKRDIREAQTILNNYGYAADVDETIMSSSVSGRFNVAENLDLIFDSSWHRTKLKANITSIYSTYSNVIEETYDGRSWQGGLQLNLGGLSGTKPYMGIGYFKMEGDATFNFDGTSILRVNDSDSAMYGEIGLQFETSRKTTLNLEYGYTGKIFGRNSSAISATLNMWSTPDILLSLGAGLNFYDGEKTPGIQAGCAWAF